MGTNLITRFLVLGNGILCALNEIDCHWKPFYGGLKMATQKLDRGWVEGRESETSKTVNVLCVFST